MSLADEAPETFEAGRTAMALILAYYRRDEVAIRALMEPYEGNPWPVLQAMAGLYLSLVRKRSNSEALDDEALDDLLVELLQLIAEEDP